MSRRASQPTSYSTPQRGVSARRSSTSRRYSNDNLKEARIEPLRGAKPPFSSFAFSTTEDRTLASQLSKNKNENESRCLDGRNDESEEPSKGEDDCNSRFGQHEDDSPSTMAVIAPSSSPPPPPPRQGVAARHAMWQLTSYFAGGSHVEPPASSASPRTPPPSAASRYGIHSPHSPPEPRRILCGASLFRVGEGRAAASSATSSSRGRDSRDEESPFPVQARYQFGQAKRIAVQAPIPLRNHQIVGHPSLKVHRLRLPSHLLPLLDTVVSGCEQHASGLPIGWQTDLYSLTKQDIALREVPHIYNAAKPIIAYVKQAAALVYGISGPIKMDRNQPHVLKYNCNDGRGHTGVELHHDKCDFTVNLMLSRSETYSGGGTYFPDAETVVRLEFGEFLLHPGGLVHGGVNITQGTRYLMVLFANEK